MKTNYKGYELTTTPNGTGEGTLIYKGGEFIGGTFAIVGVEDSIEKAKLKVDYHLEHGELRSFAIAEAKKLNLL